MGTFQREIMRFFKQHKKVEKPYRVSVRGEGDKNWHSTAYHNIDDARRDYEESTHWKAYTHMILEVKQGSHYKSVRERKQ